MGKLADETGYDNMTYRLDIGTGFYYCKIDVDGDGKPGKTDPERSKELVNGLIDYVDVWKVHGYCINAAPLYAAI